MLARKQIFTPAEYLALEQVTAYKNEYYNGEIFALSSGTPDHSLIAVNCAATLHQLIAAKPCRVFNSDMRLHIQRSGLYTYPDVLVVCGKIQYAEQRKDTLTNPIVLVEVLSESTRDYDRGKKFNFYKQIPSLQEYVLVESEHINVQVYRRAGELWAVEMFDELEASIQLASIECGIALAQIYAKVSWLE